MLLWEIVRVYLIKYGFHISVEKVCDQEDVLYVPACVVYGDYIMKLRCKYVLLTCWELAQYGDLPQHRFLHLHIIGEIMNLLDRIILPITFTSYLDHFTEASTAYCFQYIVLVLHMLPRWVQIKVRVVQITVHFLIIPFRNVKMISEVFKLKIYQTIGLGLIISILNI